VGESAVERHALTGVDGTDGADVVANGVFDAGVDEVGGLARDYLGGRLVAVRCDLY
jgi:hypothetical protein